MLVHSSSSVSVILKNTDHRICYTFCWENDHHVHWTPSVRKRYHNVLIVFTAMLWEYSSAVIKPIWLKCTENYSNNTAASTTLPHKTQCTGGTYNSNCITGKLLKISVLKLGMLLKRKICDKTAQTRTEIWSWKVRVGWALMEANFTPQTLRVWDGFRQDPHINLQTPERETEANTSLFSSVKRTRPFASYIFTKQ